MRIEIAQRYKPFLYTPGSCVLIPGTFFSARVYPGRVELYYKDKIYKEISLLIKGPISHFLILLDLEKWKMTVSGKEKEGFFRYHIWGENNKLHLLQDKGREPLFPPPLVAAQAPFLLAEEITTFPKNSLRLALGVNKKLHWGRVKERNALEEILPIWLQAGLPYQISDKDPSALHLPSLPSDGKKERLLAFFQAGFSDLFVPRIKDKEYQNIFPDNRLPWEDPFTILAHGALSTLSIFCVNDENKVYFQTPIFHSGRMTHFETDLATIAIRWSGFRHKMITLSAKKKGNIFLYFPKNVQSFRLRKNRNEKGIRISNGNAIAIEKNLCYCVDRLEY